MLREVSIYTTDKLLFYLGQGDTTLTICKSSILPDLRISAFLNNVFLTGRVWEKAMDNMCSEKTLHRS